MDEIIFEWLQNHQNNILNQNMINITALGSTTTLGLLMFFAFGFSFFVQKRIFETIFALIVILSGLAVVETIKFEMDRIRPVAYHELITRPNSPSFPSGHSAMSMAVFLILAKMFSKNNYWIFVAFACSLLIGFSRMYLGVHWFTDVLFGWIIGFTIFSLYERKGAYT
jgi:undecaprenyl-diphosphatase